MVGTWRFEQQPFGTEFLSLIISQSFLGHIISANSQISLFFSFLFLGPGPFLSYPIPNSSHISVVKALIGPDYLRVFPEFPLGSDEGVGPKWEGHGPMPYVEGD